MGDTDDVQRLISRTRDRRKMINKELQGIGEISSTKNRSSFLHDEMSFFSGESPHPIRSPLREKNETPTKIKVSVKRSLNFS